MNTAESKPLALITGASAGIGQAFAERFAQAGHPLVIVARSEPRLSALAASLAERFGVHVRPIVSDLADPRAAEELFEQCRELDVRVLVNNAGCAVKNEDQLAHPERVRAMMQLNVVTTTELALRFGSQMVARGGGFILNIGSMTAYVGASSLIGYASSKRYLISYSKELHAAFAKHQVRVSCLIPGLTETTFFSASGVPLDRAAAKRLGMLTPAEVAEQGFTLTFSGPVVEICGAKNRWLARLSPWIPASIIDRARRHLHGQDPGSLVPSQT